MWIQHAGTTPVLMLLGTQALAIYYLVVFPFRKFDSPEGSRVRWWQVMIRILSGLILALALHALALFALGWIERRDLLGNACVLLALLCLAQGGNYFFNRRQFSFEAALRALLMLLVIVPIVLWGYPLHFAWD